MNDTPLDIIHSVTIKRKPKKVLIPDSVFTAEFHSDFVQSNEYRPPNLSPWRVTSSGVVARRNPNIPQNKPQAESSNFHANETMTLNFPRGAMAERLRTPMRNKPNKPAAECDSILTRNCEQLFSRMSTFKEVKPEIHADPSQSVRRIIKGSGLLKSFGTGIITEDELVENRNSEVGTSEITDVTTSSQNDDLNSSRSESPQLEKNSFQLFSSQSLQSPTTPLFYDTLVLKKTVETEFVEYLPPKNYEGFQLFSTSCDYKGTYPDTTDSPPPTRKKRARFDDQFLAEDFLFQ